MSEPDVRCQAPCMDRDECVTRGRIYELVISK
jgi:hypothetical protein